MQQFRNYNMSFNLQKYNMMKLISLLNNSIASALENINNKLLLVIAKCINYVQDYSEKKSDLANEILSPYFHAFIETNIVKVTQDIRRHGKDLMETWSMMHSVVQQIWTKMILETSLKEFYTNIMSDLFIHSDDRNFSAPVLELANQVLHSSNQSEELTFKEIVHLLNADIAVIQLSNKTVELNAGRFNFSVMLVR